MNEPALIVPTAATTALVFELTSGTDPAVQDIIRIEGIKLLIAGPEGAVGPAQTTLALTTSTAGGSFTEQGIVAATILTVQNRTLPAQVFGSLGDSPLPFRFAGGFALIVPSLVFIFFIRRYLFNMWGRVVK